MKKKYSNRISLIVLYLLVFLLIVNCPITVGGISIGPKLMAWDGTEPLIVDHNSIDITQIPLQYIEAAKDTLHIAYGHTSHGSQIPDGMSGLVGFANNGGKGLAYPENTFAWNGDGSNGALHLQDYYGNFGGTGIASDLGNPNRTAWEEATRTFLANNDDINVIIWSWCGQVSDASEGDINTYLNLMDGLEEDFPGVTFVYMTGHLDGSGADGNLNTRNEQIRNYCIENNKVLFDFADIESYDPDGLINYMQLLANDACDYDSDENGSRDRNWATSWQNSHTEDLDWYECGSAHSQPLNANMKAYAAWWLWASLAGWDGSGTGYNDTAPPTKPGNLTVDSVTGNTVNLSWSTSTDPTVSGEQSSGVAGYRVYRDGNYVRTSRTTNYSDTGLSGQTEYTYTVAAYDRAGNIGEQSDPVAATTLSNIRNAFEQLEAEDYDEAAGNIHSQNCSEGGSNIGWIEDGLYIRFDELDFADGADSFTTRIASANSGGQIEIHLNAVDGDLIGTCGVPGTGGWQNWQTVDCNVSAVSGVHNLYLVFTGGADYLFNINWFVFGTEAVSENNPPVLAAIGNRDVTIGSTLEFTLNATDADGDALTYSADNMPQGASFDTDTFSWTPTADDAGTYTVTFTVSDGEDSDSETVTITVINNSAADTTAPTVPENFEAVASTQGVIKLYWNESRDPLVTGQQTSGLDGYRILRNGEEIGTTASTFFTDKDISAEIDYEYSVSAYDNEENESAPATVSINVPKFLLDGTAVDYRRIDLYWTAKSVSETSPEEIPGKFEVYKDGALFKKITQKYINEKYYISHSSCDYPVEEESTHRYYVRGYDINGDFIGQSNEIEITTPTKYNFDYMPAFPGAEGFGAKATGGRGGRVVYVTNLESDGPGSLKDAVLQTGPRYILFKVSGSVSLKGWFNMNGDYTLAGQTSPGGIITKGFITSSAEDYNYQGMNNVIIRHLRARPDTIRPDSDDWPDSYTPSAEELTWGSPGGSDDAFRLANARDVIVDHCSLGRAGDECFQLSTANFITVQNTILAETLGTHYGLGGMLIVYSTPEFPLNNLSIHHNMWNRLRGRLPEMSNNEGNANDHVFNYELSNNLIWDPNGGTVWVNNTGRPYNPQDKLYLDLNWIGNYMRTRDDHRSGMITRDILGEGFSLYLNDNRMSLYPDYSDYQIVYGNNDFYVNNPNTDMGDAEILTERHPYAPITYTPSLNLVDYMIDNVGAFPRDPMDRRLLGYLEDDEIDPTHLCARPANDGHAFDWSTPPVPPLDSDDDGMPDWWEIYNGLNPLLQDHNGKELSSIYTDYEDYDNLEVYLNRLSDNLVSGESMTEGRGHQYPVEISEAVVSETSIIVGTETELTFTITPANPDSISTVELSLDNLIAPYASPSPDVIDITGNRNGGSWTYTYTASSELNPGIYQVLAHVVDHSGQDGYQLITVNILYDNIDNINLILPKIQQQPASQAVLEGEDVSLVVRAYGTPPLSYQWYKDEVEISGEISKRLNLDNVSTADTGEYTVEITNGAGSVTSEKAILTVVEPLPVVDVNAESEYYSVYLSWNVPENQGINWDKILVISKKGSNPAGPDDGKVIYDGIDSSIIDKNLDDGEYHYASFTYKQCEGNNVYSEIGNIAVVTVPETYNKSVLRIEADEENSIIIGQNTRGDLYSLWNSEKNTIGIGQTGNETGLWLYSELAGNIASQVPAGSEIISARLVFNVEGCSFSSADDDSPGDDSSSNDNNNGSVAAGKDIRDYPTIFGVNTHSIDIYQITDPNSKGMPYYSNESGIRTGLDFNYRDHRAGINKLWVDKEDTGYLFNENQLDLELKGSILDLIDDLIPVDSIEFSPDVFVDELADSLQFDITTAIQNWTENSGEYGENQGLYISIGEGWENGETISLYGVTAEEGNQQSIKPYIEIIYGSSGDLTGPDPVEGLHLNPEISNENTIALNWTNPDDTDLAGIKIVRQEGMLPYNDQSGDFTAIIARDNSNNISNTYIDTGLETGKIYYYALYAYDSQHNYSEPVYIKAIPGSLIEAIEITGDPTAADGELRLNWGPLSGINNYRVYRKDINSHRDISDDMIENNYNKDGFTGYRLIAEIKAEQAAETVSFTDYLMTGEYSYRIAAVSENGEGQLSDELSIEINEDNRAAVVPAAPVISDQDSRAISGSEIELQWTDHSDNESLFIIEREMVDEEWQEVGRVRFDELSFTDQGMLPVTEYTYRVKAVNSAGEFTVSDKISINTMDELVAVREISWEVISTSQVKVEWEDLPNEDGYVVEVLDGEDEILERQELSSDVNYFYLVALEPDREYRVMITTVIGNDNKAVESDIIRTSMDPKGGLF